MKLDTAQDAPWLLNLKDYPIDDLTSQRGQELVKSCMEQLDCDGFLSLRNFLLPSANAELTSQITSLIDNKNEAIVDKCAGQRPTAPGAGYFSASTHNVYLQDSAVDELDSDILSSDPRVCKQRTSLVCVGADELPAEEKQFASLADLYKYPALIDFLRTVLLLPSLYVSDDPMGKYYFNVYDVGEGAGWHFDQSEYSVILMIKPAPRGCGGLFQYAPSSRGLVSEMDALPGGGCPEAIADFFRSQEENKGRTCLKEPDFHSGDLCLFRGKESMHRVTCVTVSSTDADAAAGSEIDSRRISLILTYNSTPGRVLTDFLREKFFGRTKPATHTK